MEVLRKAAYQRMPWKNGRGETLEIAVSPPGTTFDTLDWRVSMASVAQDGPFSTFPGIDRTLCVIDGTGLQLDFGADGGTHIVRPDSAPFHFAADRALFARLLSGPIIDLNVMTRTDRYRQSVHRLAIDDQQMRVSTAEQSLIFCGRGDVSCTMGSGTEIRLTAHDCLLIRHAPAIVEMRTAQSVASVYLIQFYPTTATPA